MRWALLLVMGLTVAPASRASAHGFEVGVLALHELEPGRFAMRWRPPEDSRRATPARVTIRFPDHCRRHQQELRCGAAGLHGAIAFDDLPDPRSPIVVRIERLDGRRLDAVVRGDAPALEVGRASGLVAAMESGARAGHVLVLLALLLVVGVERRGLPSLAGLVFGHALGLALASLAGLPSAPLDALGAVGVMLLARGAAQGGEERSWVLLAPLLGATLGLAHADALPLIGVAAAALTDVVLLGILALLLRAGRAWIERPLVRRAAAYAVGVAGALWLVERAALILA